ncbi:MAG TPA: hypothetical protein VL171_00075 [Verrucomicrobiae bacterium]|nr:hypothetical protein [Verrucomicrobiae bacterium]
MEQRNETIDSLGLMIRYQREEIQRYRWLESEKAGRDIGWERAEREWRRQHARAWRRWLRTQGLVHPMIDWVWSQQNEIESEQRGYDIGWERAVREWSQKHYEAWRHHMTAGSDTTATNDVPSPRSRRRCLRPEHRSHISSALKEWWKTRRKAEHK